MIQVDVFWSFGMGALFAAMAGTNLKKTDSMFVNKYFMYTICFLSMIFAPSGVYLLWHYPGWETMFFLDRDLHGIWACLFAHTNVSLGVLGFCIGYRLIKNGDDLSVHKYWTTSHTCMFAILTLGYDRFLYAGTQKEFNEGVEYGIQDFFHCEVFRTLLVMGVFVLPPLYYAMITWPAQAGMTSDQKTAMLSEARKSYLGASAIVLLGYTLLFMANQLPPNWGYDRALAFMIGQVVFGTVFSPLLFINTQRKKLS